MADSYSTLATTLENGVFTITLNRPDALNAYSREMGVELGAAFRMAQRDDSIRCIVLTGAGRAFSAGQDLQEIKDCYSEGGQPLDFGAHLRNQYNTLITRIRSLEKPVVAAVNGVAAGAGASFAFACDLRICTPKASFVMAFVNIGLIPDSAATLTLVQHVGYARAAELCMLGEKLSAEDALRFGLVNRVVEEDHFEASVRTLAEKLAALPTRAIGLTKRALNRAWTATLADQLEYEAFLQATAGGTQDHTEGVRAFLEKRQPTFSGQ